MKVICIKDDLIGKRSNKELYRIKIDGITLGKIYDSKISNKNDIEVKAKVYLITDDRGEKKWFSSSVLIPLEEFRESQFKKLGII